MNPIKTATRGQSYIDTDSWNELVRRANVLPRMRFDPTIFTVKNTGDMIMVSTRSRDTFDWSKIAFGFSIAGQIVTIYAGELQWGAHAPVPVGDSDRDFTALADAEYYIAAEFYFAGQALTIGSPVTVKPYSDATNFRQWLHLFEKSGSTVTHKTVGHIGNIVLPGVFAA